MTNEFICDNILTRNEFKSSLISQNWSFPHPIIYYTSTNPSSPKMYQKFIQSCKELFAFNPVLVMNDIKFANIDSKNVWSVKIGQNDINYKNLMAKYWITDGLQVQNRGNDRFFASTIIPKVFRHDIKNLVLKKQHLHVKDFGYLSHRCKDVSLIDVSVKDDDSSIVSLERLLHSTSVVKKFKYTLPADDSKDIVTSHTFKELSKIVENRKLNSLKLSRLHDGIDINKLSSFIANNKDSKIDLMYNENISQEYKNRLQLVINQINDTENPAYIIPLIYFDGVQNYGTLYLRQKAQRL